MTSRFNTRKRRKETAIYAENHFHPGSPFSCAIHDSPQAEWVSIFPVSRLRLRALDLQVETLCRAGIYPFSEARAEDFGGIFRKLVAASGDNPSFLFHPDEYAKPFFPVGEKLGSAAQQAEERKDRTTARALYLRAASVYRLARLPIPRSELGLRAWGE